MEDEVLQKRCMGLYTNAIEKIEGIQVAPDVYLSDFWSEMVQFWWRVRAMRG